MRYSALVAVLALACNGSTDTDATDTDDTDGTTDPFAQFIFVTQEATGNFTGFTSGTDYDSTVWLTQTVDPAKQGAFGASILVEDFDSGDPVPNATVELWLGNVVSGTPDTIEVSDQNGKAAFASVPSCEPFSYRVSTNPSLDETKITLAAHKVLPYQDGNDITGENFTSVSKVTYQLIPAILGINPNPEYAIVAGKAYDLDGGFIEGAQIIIYDEDGNIASDTVKVHYFVEEFPSRDQPHTSADGIWVAINVPPGSLRAEMWGVVDGQLGLLGATLIESYADTINLGNLSVGNGTGVQLPDECLQTSR
ncbi:MAG: hypothetical protein HN348_11820 [Proteobacteria bacterium]|jgi:hypothetical protein|nr:hypothetical protein [Pseudomonadota bacterium]